MVLSAPSIPPLRRSDSLDLLSPTHSLVGSYVAASVDAAIPSEDDDYPEGTSTSTAGSPRLTALGSSTSRQERWQQAQIAAEEVPGGRRLPHILSSPFNRSNINHSEYRFLHTRASHDYDNHDSNDDRHSVRSEFVHGVISNRRRYVYSAIALLVALSMFVLQTEAVVYVTQDLHFEQPFFLMYVTHSSWILLYPFQVGFLWLMSPRTGIQEIFKKHNRIVSSTLDIVAMENNAKVSPVRYLTGVTFVLTITLAIAGSSWYIAENLSTPSDVTAIYNCSAFFAYAFSVIILREKFKWSKVFSVLLAVLGVMTVAYGDSILASSKSPSSEDDSELPEESDHRLFGNVVIGIGAVLYGLYEVMYKRYACPPQSLSVRKSTLFANLVGASIGVCSLTVLWIALVVFHIIGLEEFKLPSLGTAFIIAISVLANVLYSGSFLILMSLTSPVLSSVAALLSIFLVALTDWVVFSTPLTLGAIIGGLIITVAFALLAHASWWDISAGDEDITPIEAQYYSVEASESNDQHHAP
ncbi:uncharacterized protein V1518DRAFT_386022 [Limtongia smithiae]|uniref:uncharacterized protein n=1 Tax=Limtongia smithiae TaxID=1125753 RepID=UPI0034CEA6D0